MLRWSSRPLSQHDSSALDRALAGAARFLLGCQAADGAWHSDVYGPFKEGPSLTPLVLRTLLSLPAGKDTETSYRKGAAYLAAAGRGRPRQPRPHWAYLSRLHRRGGGPGSKPALQPSPCQSPRRLAGLPAQRQLTEDLGWQPADKAYGGWGYSPRLPRKPKPGEPLPPLTESNLSATLFALEALHAAGASAD